jgi:hypothetical protein
MDDFERMCNNADGEKLLAVITTLHHQTESARSMQPTIRHYHNLPVHEPFNYGHLSLLELFFGVSTSGMGKINGMADLNVICQ